MTAVVLLTVADLRSANDLVFVSLFFFLLFNFFLSKERVVYRGLKCFIDKKKKTALVPTCLLHLPRLPTFSCFFHP